MPFHRNPGILLLEQRESAHPSWNTQGWRPRPPESSPAPPSPQPHTCPQVPVRAIPAAARYKTLFFILFLLYFFSQKAGPSLLTFCYYSQQPQTLAVLRRKKMIQRERIPFAKRIFNESVMLLFTDRRAANSNYFSSPHETAPFSDPVKISSPWERAGRRYARLSRTALGLPGRLIIRVFPPDNGDAPA